MQIPTYDFEAEADSVRRKQAIAEALQAQALRPMELPQQAGVKLGPLNVLAKLMEGYSGMKQAEAVKTERGELAKRYGDELRSGMEQFYKTSEGYSAPSMALAPGADGAPQEVAVPGNRKKAVFDALASNHPVLRDFAMQELKAMQAAAAKKPDISAKDLLPYVDPSAIPDLLSSGSFKPKRDIKTLGEQFWDVTNGQPKPVGGVSYEPVQLPGGLGQKNKLTGQLDMVDKAPKTNISVSANPVIHGVKAGMEAWSKKAADTVTDMADSARQSVKMLSQLNQMEALTKGGTVAGPLADAAMFVSGLAAQAGMKVDSATLANSAAFNSVATQAWAALMQQNGGARGLVKEESEKLAQSLPALTQTPQGRAQIVATLRQAAQQNIADAKQASAEYSKALQADRPELFTFGLSATQLPQSAPTGAAPGSVSQGTKPGQADWLPPGFRILDVREK
jgi:hypothetical protein